MNPPDASPSLRIGEVARRTGLTVETIRYYERRGLIPEASRSRSGYRQFDETSVRRLRFVQRAKSLGFDLDGIRELLGLSEDPTAISAEVRRRAAAKLADIEAKIAQLQQMRDSLHQLTEACSGSGPTTECPILDALEPPELRSGGSEGK